MTTFIKSLLLTALAIAAIAIISPVALADDEPPHEYSSREELTKKFDENGDGRLDGDERRRLRDGIIKGDVAMPPAIRDRFRQDGGQETPENVTIHRDVVYGDAGERPLMLDLVLPKESSEQPRPLIVFIHGGGWRGGDKAGGVGRVLPFVASGNYAGASIGYRLSGEATWPAQIHDCKAAIRWLRANAEKYSIDPDRIGVWGSSAGGHLVNMLGCSGDVAELEGDCGSPDRSSRVTCVVSFCGPSDFLARKPVEGGRRPSAVDMLLGGAIEDNQELARRASPVTYVSKDDPPFLLVHGDADGTVPFEHAELLSEAQRKAGVDTTLVRIRGGGHGIGGQEVHKRVAAFFDNHLRDQDVEVSDEPIEYGQPKRGR